MGMDIFDVSDSDILLPRRSRRVVGLALVIGIAFVPAVHQWFLDQVMVHAQHVAAEIADILITSAATATQ